MFKMKFMNGSVGCDPEEETNIDDMSHKRFLCKIVDHDPLENIDDKMENIDNKMENIDNKKLIFTNINGISYYSNQCINTINNVTTDRDTGTRQFKHRKRIGRKCYKIRV